MLYFRSKQQMITRNQAVKMIALARKHITNAPIGPLGVAAVTALNRADERLRQGYFDFARQSAIVSLGYVYSDARVQQEIRTVH